VTLEWRVDRKPDLLRVFGLIVSLLASLTACQQPFTGPAETRIDTSRTPVTPAPLQSDPQYLLTMRGDYVLSNAPPGVEISLGSKQVRGSVGAMPVEAPGRAAIDSSD
jgi:hypothetical protein